MLVPIPMIHIWASYLAAPRRVDDDGAPPLYRLERQVQVEPRAADVPLARVAVRGLRWCEWQVEESDLYALEKFHRRRPPTSHG